MSTSTPAHSGPLTGAARSTTILALALGTFMQVLDTTIANVSIPTIAGNLGVSADSGTWIITSFAVANGISVPLTGWLMERYGVVRTFVASVLLFTATSFLCGIAWSLPVLLLFRVAQGAVSGPMIPGSQALLLTLFPEEKKGSALAIWSMTTLVAPVCGPILGGYISDNYHWTWIFLINVPVGLFCAFICWHFLKQSESSTRRLPIDRIGLALLVVWVGALQVMLDQGKNLDWFADSRITALAVVTGVSLVAWIIWEQGERNPIVDLSLFRSRNFTLGTVALCLGYAVYFGNVVLTPLWLQTQLAYTATWAGLVAAPSGLTALLVAPLAGRFIARMDARILATLSFAIFAISHFMRADTYTADASFSVFVIPLLVQGVALGLFFVPLLSILLDGLPPDRIPAASGLTNFLRITAGSFATSLTTTFWDRREAVHQSSMVESLSAYDPHYANALVQLHAHGLIEAAPAAVLRQVVGQSYLLSSLDLFYLSGWLTLLLVPLCWLARRPKAAVAVASE